MSAAATSSPPAAAISTSIGLGYAIAIALGFLVLLTAALLTSYICCRRRRNSPLPPNPNPHVRSADGGIILPRVIFVAEDDDDGDQNGEIHCNGLDQAVINSYPKIPYQKSKDGIHPSSCSICLCDYRDGEMLRMMPDCRHFFHLLCLDAWLRLNGSCPVCRNSPLPTPLSTPLSEVVPLSQYSGGGRTRREYSNSYREPRTWCWSRSIIVHGARHFRPDELQSCRDIYRLPLF